MHQVFEDYLFSQGCFVSDSADGNGEAAELDAEQAAWTLVALARYARICITDHPELASLDMLEVAKRNIGFNVPLAFYRGFPGSVRKLTPFEFAFDQVLHYYRTYVMGDFSRAGRSLFENLYERAAFAEAVTPKRFAIIERSEADALFARMAEGFLASTRPLNDTNYQLLKAYLEEYAAFPVEHCACKDTAVRLIIDVGNPDLARLIELSDVIRLVEWLVEMNCPNKGASIRKLNLRNRDRKLIAAVLDRLLMRENVNMAICLEKKRAWNGLLHHIHYQPKCEAGESFCRAMRTKDQRSAYSAMEKCLAEGDVRGATDVLRASKGPGAVLRHLDYLLSRCDTEDVAYVLDACETHNKIILMQLLLKYGTHSYPPNESSERIFTFVYMGKLRKHYETEAESARRKSILSAEVSERVVAWLQAQLERACRGTLGKVYVDDELRYVAVPLQEGASMGGFGTLPRGTRIPLPADKKVRAFTYWEKVDDIDLSCLALYDSGDVGEYSWRTMAHNQSEEIAFSGDQTSGYYGGSEFFDVDLAKYAEKAGPDCGYLVFCANVYRGGLFDECICRAGYMLRDVEDSGEVFEPSTVKTSFIVSCSSRCAYLFAIDLRDPALIWLNLGEQSMRRIAGEGDVSFLGRYLQTVDVMNVRDFACLLATEVVDALAEADTVFADDLADMLNLNDGQDLIRSCDTARILELLN